jgi:ubiquinone/menaquinone biosynthesis C-methylase UbiE/uncharacterized protein YbaR (Trm112 family)
VNDNIGACFARLVCPRCHSSLRSEGDSLRCVGSGCGAVYTIDNGIPFLAPDIDLGKYDETYANKYAGLWAHGYETLNFGDNESLYRTVSELILANADRHAEYTIVDAGCGVGRLTGACGKTFGKSTVFGLDASKYMLNWAYRVCTRDEPVVVDLSGAGFGTKTIPGMKLPNVCLAQADVLALPFCDDSVDIGLSINIVDRASDPRKVISEMYRVLKKGGLFVFTSPLNWCDQALWEAYPDGRAVLKMIADTGFLVEEWFDGLRYREVLDARGSYEEWITLVVQARR